MPFFRGLSVFSGSLTGSAKSAFHAAGSWFSRAEGALKTPEDRPEWDQPSALPALERTYRRIIGSWAASKELRNRDTRRVDREDESNNIGAISGVGQRVDPAGSGTSMRDIVQHFIQ
jgi:hypothetical protein